MTSKQQKIYDLPQVREFIIALDCIPLESKEEKFNKAVAVRVAQMIEGFEDGLRKPQVKRTVTMSYEDWSRGPKSALMGRNEEIEGYLETVYGKRPWRWPLEKAPF
jgi:hypothetical protein